MMIAMKREQALLAEHLYLEDERGVVVVPLQECGSALHNKHERVMRRNQERIAKSIAGREEVFASARELFVLAVRKWDERDEEEAHTIARCVRAFGGIERLVLTSLSLGEQHKAEHALAVADGVPPKKARARRVRKENES